MNPNPGRELSLQSYNGGVIRNIIDSDPSPQFIQHAKASLKIDSLLQAGIKELLPATGRYNCHGLFFASRRTNIDSPNFPVDIDTLLKEDLFVKIKSSPIIGDIAVYRAPNGSIDHTGFVSRIEIIGFTNTVFVWSKWGALEEYEHREMACPYNYCMIEYWRLV